MEVSIARELAQRLLEQQSPNTDSSSSRLIIGIAGIPGAGKSTLTNALAQHLDELMPGSAVVVPMDGLLPNLQNSSSVQSLIITISTT
jgi:putative protein kinase ArgK-like GTPase of G3E family